MAKLILDTSTWLDLAKPRIEEVLAELEQQVAEGITVLLTCNIIVEEWNRNKERVLQDVLSSIRAHAKSALKMAEYLDEKEKKSLTKIVEKYTRVQTEQEALAIRYFERVETLLMSSEIYTISDQIKIDMANRAVARQAPFHNSKNNMADALLYYGAVEHVKLHSEIATDLIFVTSNYKEFSDPSDLTRLHPDLNENIVHFYNNVAKALEMRKEVIDLLDEYNEHKFWEWIEWEAEMTRSK